MSWSKIGFAALCSVPWIVAAFGGELKAVQDVNYKSDVAPLFASCTGCHNSNLAQGGLDMSSVAGLQKGGFSGSLIVPGDPAKSVLMQRLRGEGGKMQMPMGFKPLSSSQLRLVEQWIKEGAAFSAVGDTDKHWSYVAPLKSSLSAVSREAWPNNEIDSFILARLDSKGISPSRQAEKSTLVRRVYLDLIGVPPTIEEMERYLSDTAPGAYERLVDRLLASKQFGERQAIHWLDLARYADTDGYEKDARRIMWPYRDWVINALNADMPFDQFTIEQLAGDLLPDPTKDQLIATGFHRNTMHNREGGVDQGEQRWLTMVDRVATTGAVWLGTSLECAQCHTHKFDPITMEEYYRFLAFFDNCEEPTFNVQDPLTQERVKKLVKSIADLEKVLPELEQESDAFKTAQRALGDLRNEANALNSMTTLILRESNVYPPTTPIRIKGTYLDPGETVTANTPAVLPPISEGERKNRLGLALWLVDRENPLTARVVMNRMWEQYFGTGLVKTSADFGSQGERPSHPELLDWLAVEFMESGWSMKHMHRLIVSSATYRQSSDMTSAMLEVDPDNRLLARGARFRLPAEAIRDNALAAAGLLSKRMGGPSVFPDQPAGIWNLPYSNDVWVLSEGEDKFRRGVYTFWRRSSPYPSFVNFDAMPRENCIVRREPTNTPLQALTLMNDEAYMRAARGLARRMMESDGRNVEARVVHGFRRCVVRRPDKDERALLVAYYQKSLQGFIDEPTTAKALIKQDQPFAAGFTVEESAAWTMVANVMLNLDEMITKE